MERNKVFLKDLKKGDLFYKSLTTNILYVKDEFDRSLKKYIIYKYYDTNHFSFLKGNSVVFVETE